MKEAEACQCLTQQWDPIPKWTHSERQPALSALPSLANVSSKAAPATPPHQTKTEAQRLLSTWQGSYETTLPILTWHLEQESAPQKQVLRVSCDYRTTSLSMQSCMDSRLALWLSGQNCCLTAPGQGVLMPLPFYACGVHLLPLSGKLSPAVQRHTVRQIAIFNSLQSIIPECT